MALKSRRVRWLIAVIGVVWILTIMVLSLVPRRGPTLRRAAVVVYGGFGLVMAGAFWFGKDESAALRRAQTVAFIAGSSLVVLGALLHKR